MKNIVCIILAAGKGTRMKSSIPKVLHPICGRPILAYVLDLVQDLKISKSVVVLGHGHEQVKKHITPGIKTVIQKRPLGTADAVKLALPLLKNFKGSVLVLYADNPLLTKETIKKLISYHKENKAAVTLLTAKMDKPAGCGRILRDKYFSICGIVEEKDADDFQKNIKEVNTGVVCFNKNALAASLKRVKANNRKKEYYLTDVTGILYKNGALIDNVEVADVQETLGVNSRLELSQANSLIRKRINEELMKSGISIVDPDTTFIDYGAKIGADTVIYPFTVIASDVKIGKRCLVGPFVHLREGARLGDDVTLGNFIEIVRSSLNAKTLMKHFGYIGDSSIGKLVNIGAGTVTANFDGLRKSHTVIKDKAFIGSDTVLIAPVKIGRAAKTGAGAIVAKNTNVPDNIVMVGMPAKPLKKKR